MVKRKCPTCGRAYEPSEATAPFRPFCSARCRAADLGKWLDGGYRIASPLNDDLDEAERVRPDDAEGDPDAPSKLLQ